MDKPAKKKKSAKKVASTSHEEKSIGSSKSRRGQKDEGPPPGDQPRSFNNHEEDTHSLSQGSEEPSDSRDQIQQHAKKPPVQGQISQPQKKISDFSPMRQHENDEYLKSTHQSNGRKPHSQPKMIFQPDVQACVHHAQPFAFFCETCEEPICTECTIVGPHNNQLHRVNRMNEAFKARYLKLQDQIQINLVSKKAQILAQIHRIEYRIEEIRYVKTIIERDARLEYEGLLDRLRQAEGTKLALLHHDIAELQKDLDQINDVGSTFASLTGTDTQDLSQFLLRSRNLYNTTEHLTAKPFKTSIDVYPYDLPRELTELRLQLQKAAAQKQLIDFKNEVIWRLLNEKKEMYANEIQQELERQTNEEIDEWAKLVDKFQSEIERYQVVCCFCGVLLDPKIVNLPCSNNKEESQILVETIEQPAQNNIGNERHFFSKAKE